MEFAWRVGFRVIKLLIKLGIRPLSVAIELVYDHGHLSGIRIGELFPRKVKLSGRFWSGMG